ncbi:MAG: hypothetical protein Q8K23_00315 [Sulfuritalea sp.]|nr:hypothetical protein [Sulfuritalea sp.]
MGALGIECKEQGSNQGVRDHGKGFYDARYAKNFIDIGKKKREGVYTSKITPYNRPSLLLAEPLKEEKEGGSSLKTKQPIGVGACCAGGGGG